VTRAGYRCLVETALAALGIADYFEFIVSSEAESLPITPAWCYNNRYLF
jgi:hypothetical protein